MRLQPHAPTHALRSAASRRRNNIGLYANRRARRKQLATHLEAATSEGTPECPQLETPRWCRDERLQQAPAAVSWTRFHAGGVVAQDTRSASSRIHLAGQCGVSLMKRTSLCAPSPYITAVRALATASPTANPEDRRGSGARAAA